MGQLFGALWENKEFKIMFKRRTVDQLNKGLCLGPAEPAVAPVVLGGPC